MNSIWAPEAEASLQAVLARLRNHAGEAAADRLQARVADVSAQIRLFPMLGRIVPEYELSQLRERIVDDFRLLYHVKPDGVEVVAFLHGSTDLRSS